MKNLKKNIMLFITVFVLTITCALTFTVDKVYANFYDNCKGEIEYQIVKGRTSSSSRSSYSSRPNSSSSFKPKSSNSKSSNSYVKPKQSTIKPDSGNFSTKPKSNQDKITNSKTKSSTIKPDSGSFSTKPKTNSNEKSKSIKNKKYDTYDDYESSKRTYIPSTYGRGFFGFGGYNPFRYMGYRMGISPIIMNMVVIITILIVLYVILDFIRNRRNR